MRGEPGIIKLHCRRAPIAGSCFASASLASFLPPSPLLGPHEGRLGLRPEPNRPFPSRLACRFAPSILIYLDDSVRVHSAIRPSVHPLPPPLIPSIFPQSPRRRCPRDRASHAIREGGKTTRLRLKDRGRRQARAGEKYGAIAGGPKFRADEI